MNLDLRPTGFQLAALTTLNLGPLQGLSEIRLTSAKGEPTNIYMVMGPNGAGKTTALEAIFRAMRLLEARGHREFGMDSVDTGDGGVQLDARVVLDDGNRSRVFLLSIVAGRPGLLKRWTQADLEPMGADRQIVLAFEQGRADGGLIRGPGSDPEAVAFADAILERLGEHPVALLDSSNAFPTVLYFPSDRGIRRPPDSGRAISRPDLLGYRPAHRFGADGTTWVDSLDNLFVWFAWLNDGREKLCREIVNDFVFRGAKRLAVVDRQTLTVPVEVGGDVKPHRIDQLSSGERHLVQLVVRIASHMTGSTIVLIDEAELHLHLVMRRRLINLLKRWAAERDMSFILTSHQADSMRLLAPKQEEPGLVKGGCLVRAKVGRPNGQR